MLVVSQPGKEVGRPFAGTLADLLNGGRNGAAVKPGSAATSLLLRRVTGEVAPRMPLGAPAALGRRDRDSARVDRQGARATPGSAAGKPKWEAPLTLERPPLPPVVWKKWEGPVDRFVASYLAAPRRDGAARLSPTASSRAAPTSISRACSRRPRRCERSSPIPVRTSATRSSKRCSPTTRSMPRTGSPSGTTCCATTKASTIIPKPRRVKASPAGCLHRSKSNMPYNQFVAKLLNPVAPGDPDGFLIGVNWRGVVNASQTPAMQAAQNTAQIFLGVNLKCNSCHDSFISKWKLKDAYALATYF